MGPQPFGCGRRAIPLHLPMQKRSFNGAATFRLRKVHGQTAARKQGSASMGPQPFGCGRQRPRSRLQGHERASMGPQPFGCGRLSLLVLRARPALASMGPQPFGCGRSARSSVILRLDMLQWGRNLSVAEGPPCPPPNSSRPGGFNGAATFRLRKAGAGGATGQQQDGFNGAATFRLRKAARPQALKPNAKPASMGPQPFGCGRDKFAHAGRLNRALQWGRNLSVAEGVGAVPALYAGGLLQWGRNLSVAEGRPLHLSHDRAAASMGPQPFGCGRALEPSDPACRRQASMGPQPFGCGRVKVRNVELDNRHASMGPQPFGCGRQAQPVYHRQARGCFNGAATFRLRKACGITICQGRLKCFNGAATFRLRKVRFQNGSAYSDEASMGPQPFGCGRGRRRWGRRPRGRGFNGAATFRLRKADGRRTFNDNHRALQWGRNLSVAEGFATSRKDVGGVWLQWGRNLSVAEGSE